MQFANAPPPQPPEFEYLFRQTRLFCTIEAKDGSWSDEDLSSFLQGQPEGNSELERWRKRLSDNFGIRPMCEYDGRPIYKVLIMCLQMSQLDEAKQLLEQEFHFAIQEGRAHGCINGELINRKFDKGRGIRIICDKFGIPVEDTIGFGDSMNDIEMLQTVGTSVCMANGSETLKNMADLICPAVAEDGIAKAFEQLGL